VCVGAAAYLDPGAFGILGNEGQIDRVSRIELGLGVAIGAITFSGSVIAFLKLNGNMSGAPIMLPGRHLINLGVLAAILGLIGYFLFDQDAWVFWTITALAFLIGFLLIIPIGGADMPVVVSMLNSYSGWAAAAMGFTLHNTAMIITGRAGRRVGRDPELHHVPGDEPQLHQRDRWRLWRRCAGGRRRRGKRPAVEARSAEDAAFLMKQAEQVIIVPGYGMAVAQAQHALREMGDLLEAEGVTVKYAIHPVAGRMPGHMNVLLAEANVDYEKVFELEDINSEFARSRRRLRDRRQRRDQSGRQDRPDIAHLRHADPGRGEGQDRAVHQAQHGGRRLCRRR
jgi:NAD(P) transhydrogenase subunit beta